MSNVNSNLHTMVCNLFEELKMYKKDSSEDVSVLVFGSKNNGSIVDEVYNVVKDVKNSYDMAPYYHTTKITVDVCDNCTNEELGQADVHELMKYGHPYFTLSDIAILIDGDNMSHLNRLLSANLKNHVICVVHNDNTFDVRSYGDIYETDDDVLIVDDTSITYKDRKLLINAVVRHFKYELDNDANKHEYVVQSFPLNTETDEVMVCYRQLYAPFKVFVRPAKMFLEEVDHEKYPNIKQKYRFERITMIPPKEDLKNDR